jgi:hypothetical protein
VNRRIEGWEGADARPGLSWSYICRFPTRQDTKLECEVDVGGMADMMVRREGI